MFAVRVFLYYNHTIWQFFAGLIFADFQNIAKSAQNRPPRKKWFYSTLYQRLVKPTKQAQRRAAEDRQKFPDAIFQTHTSIWSKRFFGPLLGDGLK